MNLSNLSKVLILLCFLSACGDSNEEPAAPEEGPGAILGKGDIYGDDSRYEYYDFADHPTVGPAARAAVMMLSTQTIDESDTPGYRRLATTTLEEGWGDYCPGERFGDQPTPGSCTGFLVGTDLVVTAGHCTEAIDCGSASFAFGVAYQNPDDDVTLIPESDLYACRQVLAWSLDPSWDRSEDVGPDYALIQLDRPVLDREPLDIRRVGRPAVGTSLFAVTHASGLPLKIGMNGVVAYNAPATYFVDSTDSFAGSSGGAVVNFETGKVEGIVSRGPQDFTMSENECVAVVRCDEVDFTRMDGLCTGNESTFVTTIAPFIPPFDHHALWQNGSLEFQPMEGNEQILVGEVVMPSSEEFRFGWLFVPESVDMSQVEALIVRSPEGFEAYVYGDSEGFKYERFLMTPDQFFFYGDGDAPERIDTQGTWTVELEGQGLYEATMGGLQLRVIGPVDYEEEGRVQYKENFERLYIGERIYESGRFIGDGHLAWHFDEAILTRPSGFGIEQKSMVLRGQSNSASRFYQSRITSQSVAGGISSFSVQMRKAYTGAGVRQLELYVNDAFIARSEAFGNTSGADDTVYTFAVDDLDIEGNVVLELRAVGAGQIAIDNLGWTTL